MWEEVGWVESSSLLCDASGSAFGIYLCLGYWQVMCVEQCPADLCTVVPTLLA